MKPLKQFTKWFTKTGKDDKMLSKTNFSDYNPAGDFIKRFRERQRKEKENYEMIRSLVENEVA